MQLHIQCEEAEQHVTAKVSFSVEPEINLRCRLTTNDVSFQLSMKPPYIYTEIFISVSVLFHKYKQEAPMTQRDRATLRVIEYFAKSLKVTQDHSKWHSWVNVKVNVWTLVIAPVTTYMSQTRDQQRFTISEVAADWHGPMVPQCIMWLSVARANGQYGPPTIAPISHTRPSPRSRSYYSFPIPLRVGGWVGRV